MITLTDLELVGGAAVLSAVVFVLGHAAGYWRAKDVERRRAELKTARAGRCAFGPEEWGGLFIGRRHCSTHGGFDDFGAETCTAKSLTTNTRKRG